MINGQIFDEDYFEHLIAEIQEIRASERRFYQKITDIYATAVDYDKNSQMTREFYATVQNKMHYAVHGNTAAEVIVSRADHNKEHMGLESWKNASDGKIVKTDVSIAKNYLEKEELAELNEIVTMYLDYATRQARRHIPMTMEDWKTKLDAFLRFNDADNNDFTLTLYNLNYGHDYVINVNDTQGDTRNGTQDRSQKQIFETAV